MPITMTGQVQLAATREAVWSRLNDPEVLKVCLPDCEEFEEMSGGQFRAVVTTRIGAIRARFRGKVQLSDLDPPNSYRISGEGEGGLAGFAKGAASVALTESDAGTLLAYTVEAQIGGKIAQLGQRLIVGVAKRIADSFFEKFAVEVAKGQGRSEAEVICGPPFESPAV